MSTTFNFAELDDTTREYLAAVRDSEGAGAPGVFVPTEDSLPGCGCIAGPIIVVVTLILTLTTWTPHWLNVVVDDPFAVAALQTAWLVVGGWLALAGFRGKPGRTIAGSWVYVDPLHLYEAYREQVTVTPIDEAVDASVAPVHDSNGKYQNSVVTVVLGRQSSVSVTIKDEARAEKVVTFLNYVVWARGAKGGDRATLSPAELGGLAKYVVRNGDEPKDAEDNVNLELIELDITAVPEEPTRDNPPLSNIKT